MSLVESVLPLGGVALGAVGSYLATRAGDRTKWDRVQATRWDARRVEAYVEFAFALMNVYHLCRQLAAGLSLPTTAEALPLDEGVDRLVQLRAEASVRWETVRLLGQDDTVDAGRAWRDAVWELDRIVRGVSPRDPDGWRLAKKAADHERVKFYAAARSDLGVANLP